MVATHAANAYARIGLETGVAAASPQRLVVMLYDGALAAIADGRAHLVAGRTAPKGRALGKAIGIIDEGLKAALDTTQGGALKPAHRRPIRQVSPSSRDTQWSPPTPHKPTPASDSRRASPPPPRNASS